MHGGEIDGGERFVTRQMPGYERAAECLEICCHCRIDFSEEFDAFNVILLLFSCLASRFLPRGCGVVGRIGCCCDSLDSVHAETWHHDGV